MSFLYNNKAIISAGTSGSGKSSLSSILSDTYKIRSEDVTCILTNDKKSLSSPSFPITLSESHFSQHLEKFSPIEISRKRFINNLSNKYDNQKLVEVNRIYILEWGDFDEIIKLEDGEAFKRLIINSFKPYPFNSCKDTEKFFFKKIIEIIRNNQTYLFTRKKDLKSQSHEKLIKHIENDTS